MKNLLKKVVSSVAAVTMAVTIMGGVGSSTVFAATTATAKTNDSTTATASAGDGAGTIKIELPKTEGQSGNTSAATGTTYNYKVYKVFDATQGSSASSMSYTIMSNKNGTLPTITYEDSTTQKPKFYKDSAGNVHYGYVSEQPTQNSVEVLTEDGKSTTNLTAVTADLTPEAVAGVAAYATADNAKPVADVDVASTFSTLEITGLAYGYYYVTTSTGSVVAINSTNQERTVGDKNTVPAVKKTIEAVDIGQTGASNASKGSVNTDHDKAIAEVGSTVHFKSEITVGKGAANYVFKDRLDDTLTLVTGDGKISVGYLAKDAAQGTDPTALTAGTDYELDTTAGGNGDSAYTFRILFNKDTDAAKAALSEGSKIVITYTAIVKSDALQTNSAENTAWVTYGNDPNSTHDTIPSKTDTYNAKITVVKKADSESGSNLANAGFKLKNGNGTDAKYYKLNPATTGDNPTNESITWGEAGTATELFSGNDGKLYTTKVAYKENDTTAYEAGTDGKATDTKATEASFTGLANGTYYLEETTVPDGYNKAADTQVVIGNADSENAFAGDKENTNLYQSKTIVNKTGSLLPSTGGIGTTIFYVIGGVLIAGAAILLITRRKKA